VAEEESNAKKITGCKPENSNTDFIFYLKNLSQTPVANRRQLNINRRQLKTFQASSLLMIGENTSIGSRKSPTF